MTTSTLNVIAPNSEVQASIISNKKTRITTLQVSEDMPWQIFAGASDHGINYDKPILEGNKNGEYILPIDNYIHYCFSFTTDANKIILAEKSLPVDGCYNCRDLGGIRTKYGRKIRWGKIFRSDELTALTKHDLEYLASIPLNTIIDLRLIAEINYAPDKIPASVKDYFVLSIAPGSMDIKAIEKAINGVNVSEGATNVMNMVYEQLILDAKAQNAFRRFFKVLENQENLPLLFHCTAGKDRTGLAAALLLLALGVDEQTVMEDYLASSIYLKGKYPINLDIFTVKREFLQTALNTINNVYVNPENYLVKILGINLNKLRQIYLV